MKQQKYTAAGPETSTTPKPQELPRDLPEQCQGLAQATGSLEMQDISAWHEEDPGPPCLPSPVPRAKELLCPCSAQQGCLGPGPSSWLPSALAWEAGAASHTPSLPIHLSDPPSAPEDNRGNPASLLPQCWFCTHSQSNQTLSPFLYGFCGTASIQQTLTDFAGLMLIYCPCWALCQMLTTLLFSSYAQTW